jgi:hypothetical protein
VLGWLWSVAEGPSRIQFPVGVPPTRWSWGGASPVLGRAPCIPFTVVPPSVIAALLLLLLSITLDAMSSWLRSCDVVYRARALATCSWSMLIVLCALACLKRICSCGDTFFVPSCGPHLFIIWAAWRCFQRTNANAHVWPLTCQSRSWFAFSLTQMLVKQFLWDWERSTWAETLSAWQQFLCDFYEVSWVLWNKAVSLVLSVW